MFDLTIVPPSLPSDKPGKPEGPLEALDILKDQCGLMWDKPKNDGNCPIKHYVIEKMEVDTGKWEKVLETSELECEVTKLTPLKKYLFRVSAVNSEGVSEPLVTSKEILAKDPWGE